MLYLLALLLPPVAVLACGKSGQALLNVILTLLLYFPGAIHACLVVANYYADQRTGRVIGAITSSSVASSAATPVAGPRYALPLPGGRLRCAYCGRICHREWRWCQTCLMELVRPPRP